MPRTSRPITVTLGEFQEKVEARVKSGSYASASEVLRAALRALEREETILDESLRRRAAEAPVQTRAAEAPVETRPDEAPLSALFKRLREGSA